MRGELTAPPSKSYTHRAIVLGALTGEKFEIVRPLISEDTEATLSAVSMMGAAYDKGINWVRIHCPRISSPRTEIDARNSGTTLRLISGIAALLEGKTQITGDDSLRKRPMKPLLNALRELGAKCAGEGEDEHPPVKIQGPMTGTHARLPGDVSSQFVSSLLIACPMKSTPTKIRITGTQKSRSYIDISLDMLKEFKIKVNRVSDGFEMDGRQRPMRKKFEIPGDFSSAAFLLCGAAMTNGDVRIRGLELSSPQGDAAVLKVLTDFGAKIEAKGDLIRCAADRRLPIEFDVSNTPDLFPIVAVLAATAQGKSRLFGGEHLKYKESNRIETTVSMLASLGVDAQPTADGCIINGKGKIKGGTVDTHGDHRIMMSAVIAGLASEQGVIVNDDTSYSISYPGFIDDVQKLGAILQQVRG
ncbi:MAG: 3-phosphoshikimate 1-carboxyvinyltransferase [Thermoplasmata archaeon]